MNRFSSVIDAEITKFPAIVFLVSFQARFTAALLPLKAIPIFLMERTPEFIISVSYFFSSICNSAFSASTSRSACSSFVYVNYTHLRTYVLRSGCFLLHLPLHIAIYHRRYITIRLAQYPQAFTVL